MKATPIYPSGLAATAERPQTQPYLTSRFGLVQIVHDSIIAFPDGLIGLGGSRYALLSTDARSPFLWLQSLDHSTVALPIANPHRFFADFVVELADGEALRLGLSDGQPADVYVTVTAAKDPSEITVNLRAPILIRGGHGYQVINQAPGAAVKTPLFPPGPVGSSAAAAA
jgi:flagellar assembly factor FliW